MLRCPTLQAFFESLAHGDFFFFFFFLPRYLLWSNANICLLRNIQPTEVINSPSAYDEPTSLYRAGSRWEACFSCSQEKAIDHEALPWGRALFELPHAKIAG